MNAVDVKCPICGTINKSLDLEETDGWMECESCGEVTQQIKYKKRLPIRRIVCARNLGRDRIGINLVTGKAA